MNAPKFIAPDTAADPEEESPVANYAGPAVVDGDGKAEPRKETVMMLLGQLTVDPRLQRDPQMALQRKIAKNPKPAAIGTLVAAYRIEPDGTETYVLLDGQQRRGGLMRAGFNELVQVEVHYGLTHAQMAQLFLDLNVQVSVNIGARFRLSVEAEDPQALLIADILRDFKIPLGSGAGRGGSGFGAYAAARQIVSGPNGSFRLRWALRIIQEVFGDSHHLCKSSIYNAALIQALAAFHKQYETHRGFREETLIERLRHEFSTIDRLNEAAALTKTFNADKITYTVDAIGTLLVNKYNLSVRGRNRFPAWTRTGTAVRGQNVRQQVAAAEAQTETEPEAQAEA